ncbi:hypothetical protein ACFVYJ_12405 [Pontibacter sp. JAM-7]|uniref:hypothetical protein n=1 Tax=Pontibacter sp. JAM-7 TaxID=3366581 RepID=UPI003AF6747E
MNINQLSDLQKSQQLKSVNFIESGCGPMVIEIEFQRDKSYLRELIKDDAGKVVTCSNITQGYDICHRAGIHHANLVQIIPHDEACYSEFADYHRSSLPLSFR